MILNWLRLPATRASRRIGNTGKAAEKIETNELLFSVVVAAAIDQAGAEPRSETVVNIDDGNV